MTQTRAVLHLKKCILKMGIKYYNFFLSCTDIEATIKMQITQVCREFLK